MPLPPDITFDSPALIKMHSQSMKRILEITLAKFTVNLSIVTVYRYLTVRAYLKKNIELELDVLKDIYNIVPLNEEIAIKAAQIEADLMRKGMMPDIEDVLTAATAIYTKSLLITDDSKRYEPMRRFGLDTMPLDKFVKEVELMVEKELI
ncbi:type II toxin-antitoxin system VapC family toxin [Pyrococcus woesei]|uniref:type II toxin-antitoxin system VapC family toxin n=1 Tax=Pyrococcus woesei TaxID=2262 RepID=UPI003D2EDC7F